MSIEWIKPMEWKAEGSEPSDTLKASGFQAGQKPPAAIFNYFLHREQECIEQLQSEHDSFVSGTASTFEYVGENIGALEEKCDSLEVAYREADNVLGSQLHNEITAAVTELQGKIEETNGNVTDLGLEIERVETDTQETFGRLYEDAITNNSVIPAYSSDGVYYTATTTGNIFAPNSQDGELYNGLTITVIPNRSSESTAIYLNLNGLGNVPIRRPLSFSTFVASNPTREYFFSADTPCRLMYHANYTSGGIWLMADKQLTSGQDLYGTVPLTSGGTGVEDDKVKAGAFYTVPDTQDSDYDDDTTELVGRYGVLPIEYGGTGSSTVDTTPTSGSEKMVTSGGIYNALSWNSVTTVNVEGNTITIPAGKSIGDIFMATVQLATEPSIEDLAADAPIVGMRIASESKDTAKIAFSGICGFKVLSAQLDFTLQSNGTLYATWAAVCVTNISTGSQANSDWQDAKIVLYFK